MSVFVRSVQVQRPPAFGGNWAIDGLTDVTVILGRNGTGKSRLFRSLRDTDDRNYPYVSPERGGEFAFEVMLASEEADPGRRASRRSTIVAQQFRQEAVARVNTLFTTVGGYAFSGGQLELRIIPEPAVCQPRRCSSLGRSTSATSPKSSPIVALNPEPQLREPA